MSNTVANERTEHPSPALDVNAQGWGTSIGRDDDNYPLVLP
jgi:hypothetical protein